MEHLQIRNVAWGAQVCVYEDSAAHQDALALRHARDLSRTRPPIPLRPCAALAPAGDGQRGVARAPERADVVYLEHGAVLQRRPHECMLEVEGKAGQGERQRDDVRGERCRLRVRETCERERAGCSRGECK